MKITLTKDGKTILDNEEVELVVMKNGTECYKTDKTLEYFSNLTNEIYNFELTTEDGKVFNARILPDLGSFPIAMTMGSKILIIPEEEKLKDGK